MTSIPKGYELITRNSAFSSMIGPIYQTSWNDGAYSVGLLLEDKHCNVAGYAHGGLLASLCDTFLGRSVAYGAHGKIRLVTVNLTVDYLGAAQSGGFIYSKSQVERRGGRLCHSSGGLYVDDKMVVRAHGIFQVMERPASAG